MAAAAPMAAEEAMQDNPQARQEVGSVAEATAAAVAEGSVAVVAAA